MRACAPSIPGEAIAPAALAAGREDVPVVGQGRCGSLEAKSSKGVEGAS